MLGMVFTEFLEMVEQRFSPAVADQLLTRVQTTSGGAYTAVGNYPHQEMSALVQALASHTGLPTAALVQAFGEYLFERFVLLYPGFFADQPDSFGLLASVDAYIHREVRKLYPDAELPQIHVQRESEQRLVLNYRSARAMADLAEGLIRACIRHYGETVQLQRTDLPSENGIARARFELNRQ